MKSEEWIEVEGFKYYYDTLPEIYLGPHVWFDGMEPFDTVIDLGANAGAFAIPASTKSARVLAVEPFAIDTLRANISLNDRHNILSTDVAVADGKEHTIEWAGKKRKVPTTTLTELKKISSGCDFLKCDIEGFEWFIQPEELKDIKRIEIEIHNMDRGVTLDLDHYFDRLLNYFNGEFTPTDNPLVFGVFHGWLNA
jgi:FkbM family methyltransferase